MKESPWVRVTVRVQCRGCRAPAQSRVQLRVSGVVGAGPQHNLDLGVGVGAIGVGPQHSLGLGLGLGLGLAFGVVCTAPAQYMVSVTKACCTVLFAYCRECCRTCLTFSRNVQGISSID